MASRLCCYSQAQGLSWSVADVCMWCRSIEGHWQFCFSPSIKCQQLLGWGGTLCPPPLLHARILSGLTFVGSVHVVTISFSAYAHLLFYPGNTISLRSPTTSSSCSLSASLLHIFINLWEFHSVHFDHIHSTLPHNSSQIHSHPSLCPL